MSMMKQFKMHRFKLLMALAGVIVSALSVTAIVSIAVFSQAGGDLPSFDSGSNGSDGALILTNPGTILFDPRNFNPPLDQNGDGVYHFTSITIGAGVTVKLSAVPLGTKPVVWLSQGAVQIDGELNLDGEDGHGYQSTIRPSIGGAGGYPGGAGSRNTPPAPPQRGSGPGGGEMLEGKNGGPAGHATPGVVFRGDTDAPAGDMYGNSFLLPLLGGSGGGGGGGAAAGIPNGGGGGAGGGAILIASSNSVDIGGRITADGGIGGSENGGAGSGGAIRIVARAISGGGALIAKGAEVRGGCPNICTVHERGSDGRIRLEAFDHSHRFNSTVPTPHISTPGLIFSSSPQPLVSVISVAGVNLPSNPIGDLLRPDITIDSDSNSEIQLQAQNIPQGTKIQLNIFSENGIPQIFESTPLDQNGRAMATITLPPGISRFHVQALWDPNA